MKEVIPIVGILATPYINFKNYKSRELIIDKTLIKLLKKFNKLQDYSVYYCKG